MTPFVLVLILVLASGIGLGTVIQTSYAQMDNNNDDTINTSDQVTFTDDLLLDPVAQDLLKKIGQTRKAIADLEQKEFEENQAKQHLEEMRAISLERLNQDLKEWERLWEKHSSRNAFESFVSEKPEYVRGVFWDQFEFKEQKVKAGRDALKQVLLNGGSLQEARQAYHKAAETKKIELIEMNAQFNVKHKLAYYDQQQLFNSTGQFHLSPASEISIVQYYTDYRLDPAYLLANPDDKYSTEYGSNTNPDTECREGYTVIHRINQNDYVCITESTAQIWERHGMAKIVDKKESFVDENSMVQNVRTNPGTQCKEGYSVLYHISSAEYRCVSESTAEEWINDGTGEIHDLLQYISGKDQYKVVLDKVYDINQEIMRINEEYDLKEIQLESEYEDMLKTAKDSARQAEREILDLYHSSKTMTKEDLSKQIIDARKHHESTKEKILEEKSDVLIELESDLKEEMQNIVKKYENDSDIEVTWNPDKSAYEAITRR